MANERRILVVEDQAQVAELIAQTLSDRYQPVCAASVEAAVEQLLSGGIDLVLLDCVLPGGSMWQVLLEADRIGIPVILMTGDPGQIEEVVGGWRDEAIPRPVVSPGDIADRCSGTWSTYQQPRSPSFWPGVGGPGFSRHREIYHDEGQSRPSLCQYRRRARRQCVSHVPGQVFTMSPDKTPVRNRMGIASARRA